MQLIIRPCSFVLAAWIGVVCLPASTAAADTFAFTPPTLVFGEHATAVEGPGGAGVWRLDFTAPAVEAAEAPAATPLDLSRAVAPANAADQAPVRRPVAFTYSDGYELRAKIHKYASFLTLPLFGAQAWLGFKLDDGSTSEGVRATHAAIATTMVGLFGVNTVTGVWNAWEGRANPAGRTRRLLHSVLMLASDAGFAATGLLAPTNDGGGNRSLHQSVAITSIAAATTGYLIMFFGQ